MEALNLKKVAIKKLQDDTFTIKMISIIIAIALWFYVNSIINPIKKKEVILPIKYNTTTLSKGLIMTQTSEKDVRIILNGMQEDLTKVDEKNINAYVDFSNIHETGEVKLPIKISNLPQRINIEGIYPKQVTVTIDNIVVIQKNVDIEFKGKPKKGYMVNDYQGEPNVISIKGAESDIKKINKCIVSLDMALNDKSFRASVPVKVLDQDRKDITQLFELSQNSIDVYVDILKTKQVPLVVKFKGQFPQDRQILKMEMDPSTVNIAGKSEAVDAISEIVVGTIDTRLLNDVSKFQFGFTPPKDIKVLDKVENVQITVYTEKVYEKLITLPVNLRGVSNDWETLISPNVVEINVKGTKDKIDKAENQIKVFADINNPQEGTFTVQVTVQKDLDVEITKLSPQYIDVILKKKNAQ